MTDYSELVNDLRHADDLTADHKLLGVCARAADAIEALNHLVDLNTERCEALREQLRKAHENYEKHLNELEAQMPKLGEWIDDEFTSKGRCSVCGEEWSWFDNCMETFKYCPNCGAKMEVQDADT